MDQDTDNRGMRIFLIIWLGQLISLIGSGLSEFSLGVWVYQQTGSATQFALISLFIVLPNILLSPLAGAVADRWDRRRVMMTTDSLSAVVSVILAALVLTNSLQFWMVYLVTLAISTCSAFQAPAYTASVSLLVPKKHLGRANGMVQFTWATSQIIAPLLAGALLAFIGLGGVIAIDLVTFLVGVFTLLLIRIPRPEPVGESETGRPSLLRQASYGWHYIAARPGLLGLLIFFAVINLSVGFIQGLFTPLVLSLSSSTETLGVVLSVGSIGMLAGSLAMSTWGGPKRRIHGVLGVGIFFGLCITLIGATASTVALAAICFLYFFCIPVLNGSNMAIWQSKVAPDVQGRVFAMIRMIAWSSTPLAYLIAGPLADTVFKPLLVAGGPLADSVGQIIGVGPGRGIGLLLMIMGIFPILAGVVGYTFTFLRNVEDELPDVVVSIAPAGT